MHAEANQTEQRIRKLLEKYAGKKALGHDPRIFHDLKLRGVDAADFIEDLCATFDFNFSTMRFSEYFPAEYYSPRDFVIDLFGWTDRRWKELRLSHLVDVCQKKLWFEPT
jgi:hypothetical protein